MQVIYEMQHVIDKFAGSVMQPSIYANLSKLAGIDDAITDCLLLLPS
jgi:hypothetical protein